MRLRSLSHIALAFWLGLLALTANALEEQQRTTSVVEVALGGDAGPSSGTHIMPDGRVMTGPMGRQGGHTHKGHADCVICGTAAAVAGFTLPALLTVPQPALLLRLPRPHVAQA